MRIFGVSENPVLNRNLVSNWVLNCSEQIRTDWQSIVGIGDGRVGLEYAIGYCQ